MKHINDKKVCLFLTDISDPGGIQRVVIELANAMSKFNDVLIVSVYYESKGGIPHIPYELSDKVSVICLIDKGKLKRKYIKKLYTSIKVLSLTIKLKKIRPDYIISHGMDSVIWSFLSAKLSRAKYICCDHTSYFRKPFWARLGRKISRVFADKIVVLTELDVTMWDSELVVMIPNPLPFRVEKISAITERPKKILSIGRLVEVKGFRRLLDIWKVISDERKNNGYELNIIGSGPMEAELRQYISKNDIKDVSLSEFTTEIKKIYNDARLVLVTSYYEGFSMVLIEAMYYGIPSISFDVNSGPREIIKNNSTGFLIKDYDNEEYINRLVEIINNETKIMQTMSNNCLSEVRKYELDEVMKKWDILLDSIC
ncbi:glycosyltransferase [Plesiomonas shigelloides]|uniref:glycosyltransferase n=1 Tax=Plesiomonas shigelloides TaxID=703 RepID=UPI0032605F93